MLGLGLSIPQIALRRPLGVLSWDFSGAGLPLGASFSRATGGSYFDAEGVLRWAGANEPRFDRDPLSGELRGVLIEPASANVLVPSAIGAQWRQTTNLTITPNALLAPDGTMTGTLVSAAPGMSTVCAVLVHNGGSAAGNAYSIFVKAGSKATVPLLLRNHTTATNLKSATLNAVTGAITGADAAEFGIERLRDGWWRVSIGADAGISNGDLLLLYAGWSGGNPANVETIGLWTAGLERRASATSSIATTTAAVTRAADRLSFALPSGTHDLTFTFDDESTFTMPGVSGTYTVPTNLPRRHIRQIKASPAVAVAYDPDADALFARFSTDPGAARKQLINDRFAAGKTKSFWAKLDALWVHAAHGPEAARINWLADRFHCVPVNNPAFTVDRGYMGDGSSSYLDTSFNPATATGIGSNQDSSSIGIRSNTNNAALGSLAGFFDGALGRGVTINPRTDADAFAGRVHQGTSGSTVNGAATTSVGMFVLSRTGSAAADMRMYRNGVEAAKGGNAGTAAAAPANGSYRLGSINNSSFRACQFSMAFVGAGLTAQEVRDVFDWFEPYRTAVGVQ